MKHLFKLVLLAALGFGWALPALAQNECGLNATPVRGTNGTDSFGTNHQNMCVDLVTGNIFWPRTIQGTISLNSTFNSTACRWLDWFVVGSICYPTIQPAVNAANLLSPPGTVYIPSTYAGTDSFTNPGVAIIGFRRQTNEVWHNVEPVYPAQSFPLGGDLRFAAEGAGDVYLEHDITSTGNGAPGAHQIINTNITIGANNNIAVTSTANFCAPTSPTLCGLVIDRDKPTEETIGSPNWTLVDGGHISFTAVNNHTCPCSVEELGRTFINPGFYASTFTKNPPSASGHQSPFRWTDFNQAVFMVWPGKMSDGFPWSYIAINAASGITGLSSSNSIPGTAGNLNLANAGASTSINFQRSTDRQNQMVFNDTTLSTANGFNIQEGSSTHSMAAGGQYLSTEGSNPGTQAGADVLGASFSGHCYMGSFNGDGPFCLARVITGTSTAFATATTAGTCVQNVTAVTGAATTMAVAISPVSTPGIGAVWSAFVSSAGNVTINECAVATSAGGTIAFNIRVFP